MRTRPRARGGPDRRERPGATPTALHRRGAGGSDGDSGGVTAQKRQISSSPATLGGLSPARAPHPSDLSSLITPAHPQPPPELISPSSRRSGYPAQRRDPHPPSALPGPPRAPPEAGRRYRHVSEPCRPRRPGPQCEERVRGSRTTGVRPYGQGATKGGTR